MGFTKLIDNDLFSATWNGGRFNVEQLISRGDDVNASDRAGYTALHYAAIKGHEEITKILIAAGANVNAVDEFGNMPLHYAARNAYFMTSLVSNISITLLESGAEIKPNFDGQNIFHIAIENQDVDFIKAILETNLIPLAAITERNDKMLSVLSILEEWVFGENPNKPKETSPGALKKMYGLVSDFVAGYIPPAEVETPSDKEKSEVPTQSSSGFFHPSKEEDKGKGKAPESPSASPRQS